MSESGEYVTPDGGFAQHDGHLSECATHQANEYDDDYMNRRCTCLDWFPE